MLEVCITCSCISLASNCWLETLEERSESTPCFNRVWNATIAWCTWGQNELCSWLQKNCYLLIPRSNSCVFAYLLYLSQAWIINLFWDFFLYDSTYITMLAFECRWTRQDVGTIGNDWHSLSTVQLQTLRSLFCCSVNQQATRVPGPALCLLSITARDVVRRWIWPRGPPAVTPDQACSDSHCWEVVLSTSSMATEQRWPDLCPSLFSESSELPGPCNSSQCLVAAAQPQARGLPGRADLPCATAYSGAIPRNTAESFHTCDVFAIAQHSDFCLQNWA